MAVRSRVAQQAFDLAFPVVAAMGFELVDAEYKKEGSSYYLRLFIDKRGGINIEDCENVSRELDSILDKELKAEPDFFEVSSPGLTRPLETVADFMRYEGEEIEVSFYRSIEDKKRVTGIITHVADQSVTLDLGSESMTVLYTDVASAKRIIKF